VKESTGKFQIFPQRVDKR